MAFSASFHISRSLSNCCRVRCKRYLCQMRIRTLTPTPNANSASPVINVFIGALLSPRSRRERGPLLLLDNPSYADHVFQTNQDVNCTRDTATLDAGPWRGHGRNTTVCVFRKSHMARIEFLNPRDISRSYVATTAYD